MSADPAIVKANRKTTNAREWRGDVNVSMGDETVTFKHRLLWSPEFTHLRQVLDTEAIADENVERGMDPEMGETDAQQRLLDLQQKEDLTDEEEAELQELSKKVASETSKIKEALGEEGFDLLRALGQRAIKPDEESVDYVYDLVTDKPNRAKELMGVETLPQPLTKQKVKTHLEEGLEQMVTEQPYPIRLNVGMQAMAETISVLGNGLQE